MRMPAGSVWPGASFVRPRYAEADARQMPRGTLAAPAYANAGRSARPRVGNPPSRDQVMSGWGNRCHCETIAAVALEAGHVYTSLPWLDQVRDQGRQFEPGARPRASAAIRRAAQSAAT